MSHALEELIGTSWMPEDAFFGDMLFIVIDVMPNRYPDPDVLVLDCQTGKTIKGYHDPDPHPLDSECEVLICALEKDGEPYGQQYLLRIRDK